MEPTSDVTSNGKDSYEWELSDVEMDRTAPSLLDYCTCGPGVSCAKTLIS
jgi:hypothetical protein